jgi:hypothetical protein
MVEHICNFCIKKAEAGELGVQDQPGLHRESLSQKNALNEVKTKWNFLNPIKYLEHTSS